jgi:uncharacterized membrane protein
MVPVATITTDTADVITFHILLLLLLSSTFLTSQQFSWFSKEYGSHCSAKSFLTLRHVLSITAFCIRVYRPIIIIIIIIIIIWNIYIVRGVRCFMVHL